MWRKTFTMSAAVSLMLAGCTTDPTVGPPEPLRQVESITDGLLAIETPTGVALVDGVGATVREVPGGLPAPDWSAIVVATPQGAGTLIERVDPATGRSAAEATIPGTWEVRAVAEWGEVALMAPRASGADPFAPELKDRTEIVVVDPMDPEGLRRFELEGNYEPEAFSHEGEEERSLFMLRYSPPLAPTSYRVTGLMLEGRREGNVFPVRNALEKGVVENMTATRLEQELAPGGGSLLTLYTNQPASYLAGGASMDPAHAAAFIHALDLEYGWAMCLGLPSEFVGLRPDQVAIAATGTGRVFAVDAAHDRVAVVNTDRASTRVLPVDLSSIGSGPIAAGLNASGTMLLVGASQGVAAFDVKTLARLHLVGTPGAVTGFASASDGHSFLSWDGGLGVLDVSRFEIVAEVPSLAPGPIEAVLAA